MSHNPCSSPSLDTLKQKPPQPNVFSLANVCKTRMRTNGAASSRISCQHCPNLPNSCHQHQPKCHHSVHPFKLGVPTIGLISPAAHRLFALLLSPLQLKYCTSSPSPPQPAMSLSAPALSRLPSIVTSVAHRVDADSDLAAPPPSLTRPATRRRLLLGLERDDIDTKTDAREG